MKMRENSGKKLKGSVLFTVIAVMMVIIVFVMSALTIAGATSRRAYSDYAKSQAQYTARSALDAAIQYLSDYEDTGTVDEEGNPVLRNNKFAQAISNLSVGSSVEADVSFLDDSGAADASVAKNGTAKIVAKCVSDDYEHYDGEKYTVTLLTAVVDVAGETNEESIMLLKRPGKTEYEEPDASGLTALSGISNSVSPTMLGGAGAYLVDDGTQHSINWNNSNGVINGNIVICADLNTGDFDEIYLNHGEGFVVMGDLQTGWNPHLSINSLLDKTNITDYKSIPYIYVDGQFKTSSLGVKNIGAVDKGLNIYTNQFLMETQNEQNVYADIYIFGTDKDYDSRIVSFKKYANEPLNNYINNYYNYTNDEAPSTASYTEFTFIPGLGFVAASFPESLTCPEGGYLSIIGKSSSTQLLNWASDIVNNATHKVYGGNIYSQGSMTFNGASKINGDVSVKQGVRLINNGGNVDISGSLTVGGLLVVDGNNEHNNACTASSLKVSSYDNVLIRSGYITINGVQYAADGYDIISKTYKVKVKKPGDADYTKYPNFAAAVTAVADGAISDGVVADDVYPQEMKKEELMGYIKDSEGNSLGNDSDGDGIGDNKVVYTRVDALSRYMYFDADDNPVYTNAAILTWDDVSSNFTGIDYYTGDSNGHIWKNGDTTNHISAPIKTNACLSGTFNNAEIVIEAAVNKELWILLENYNALNNTKITIKGGGTVHFFSKTHVNQWGDKLIIQTEAYQDYLNSGANPLYLYKFPDKVGKPELIPNVYLHMDYEVEDLILNMNNTTSILTAWVYAPTAIVNVTSTGVEKNNIIYKDNVSGNSADIDIGNKRICILGMALVKGYNGANGRELIAYIDDSSRGSTGSVLVEDPYYTEWDTLVYQSSDDIID